MGVLLTIGLTMVVLLVVLVPVTGLATRGRRQFGRLAPGETLKALPPAVKVDPSVEPLYSATRSLLVSLEEPRRLGAEYTKVISVLEVMDGARSSPRVYPSNWIGDLMDAFDLACERASAAGQAWLDAWAQSSQRARDELLEASHTLAELRGALAHQPFDPEKIQSNAFAYVSQRALGDTIQACGDVERTARALLPALVDLRSSPYR